MHDINAAACRSLFALLLFGVTAASCSSDCDCGTKMEAELVDYSLALENDRFKVCFSSDSSAKKDGVFYYTNPSTYEIWDCSGRGEIKVSNPALDSTFSTVLFVNDKTLFINHHKSRAFNKKYCAGTGDLQCDFWITYKEMYFSNGTIDTLREIHYPRLTGLAIKKNLADFEATLTQAKTDHNFMEDASLMKGFDYYGHAEDLLLGALNGDKASEEKFLNYRTLTKSIISQKVYSVYSDDFNETADTEFFSTALDVLLEANEYRAKDDR